jgi:predicted 3-demethylubiquinone-9 3-methyltransferase (glyoxalase superfamily)
MSKITPFLWFDDKAEEAAKFYTSIFRNSRIVSIARYGEAGRRPPEDRRIRDDRAFEPKDSRSSR